VRAHVLVYYLIKKDPSISRVERGRGGVLTEGEGGGDGQQPSLERGRSQAQENTQTGVFLVFGVGDTVSTGRAGPGPAHFCWPLTLALPGRANLSWP